MPSEPDYQLYWGDMHCQFAPHSAPAEEWVGFVDRGIREAANYLDFLPVIFYPCFHLANIKGIPCPETCGWQDGFKSFWATITRLAKAYNQPGAFVTFLGYEWTGDRTRWGDHNVVYLEDDQPLDLAMHIDELCAHLRQRNGIAIPHHTAYAPGHRTKDWSHFDEELMPMAEIISGHGCSEALLSPVPMDGNPAMGPRAGGGTIQEGLDRGCRFGFIGSNDGGPFAGSHGRGLVACYAEELTRESLWDAFHARRVYAVTGDRIKLDFTVNGHGMGETTAAAGPLHIAARVVGSAALDRIELIKNGQVIATHCHQGTWPQPARGAVRLKLRLEHGWGPDSTPASGAVSKVWDATLRTGNARIRSVEKCFTTYGQEIRRQTDTECEYRLTTIGRRNRQAVVFELQGRTDDRIELECDGQVHTFTLAELLRTSQVIWNRDETQARLVRDYGFDPTSIDTTDDMLYECAHKLKLHLAVPEAGYTTLFEFVDESSRSARNCYYVRVSQLNGQWAWSSPIWVEP